MLGNASKNGFGRSKTDHQRSDDISGLKYELSNGWDITEATNYLASGINNDGSGYLLTLFHPSKLLTKNILINNGVELQNLLNKKHVPGAYSAV